MPLFDSIGQKTFRFGANPPDANLVKLSGNFLISSVIEALGEALALIGKAGLDQHQYVDFLTSTLFNAPVYKTYGGLIADKKFEPADSPRHWDSKTIVWCWPRPKNCACLCRWPA